MKNLLAALVAILLLFGIWTGTGSGESMAINEKAGKSGVLQFVSLNSGENVGPKTPQPGSMPPEEIQTDTVRPEAVRRGGSFRSPPQRYNPGAGTPSRTPARPDNTVRNPATPGARPTPAPRTGFGGFFGGLFGGLALGTILGGLFNPFAGFSLGYPFLSIISFVLWIVVLFVLFRLFRKRNRY